MESLPEPLQPRTLGYLQPGEPWRDESLMQPPPAHGQAAKAH